MPEIKLFRIEGGDSQKTLVDKLNSNFSSVFSFGGGPYGKIGEQGPQGPQGIKGPTGSYGDPGRRGSIWTLGGTTYPISGNIEGDFWVDVNDYNKTYKYNGTSWNNYGLNLTSQDVFRKYGFLQTSLGASNLYGYFLTPQIPSNYTLVLSDKEFGATSGSSFNPQYSKMIISTDSSISGRKIMEFTKSSYLTDSNFSSKTPRFYWTPGSSAIVGNYGLNFDSNGGIEFQLGSSFTLESVNSDINLSSTGLNYYTSGLIKVNSLSGNIIFNLGSNTAYFSTSNISSTPTSFSIPNRLLFESKSGQNHSLWISTTVTGASNLRHKSNIPPSRNSYLFRSLDITNSTSYPVNFLVRGNGDFYYNKKIESIQPYQSPDNSSSVSNFFKGSSSVVSVQWIVVTPSVSLNSSSPVNSVNCNSGTTFIVNPTLSEPTDFFGISLWTGGTGSVLGWLDLLNSGESIEIKVKTSNPNQRFSFIGLNTSDSPGDYPEGSYGGPGSNGQVVDLTGDTTLGATDVDFTIMCIKSFEEIGSPNERWFKVYYTAYGGDITIANGFSPICGSLYTYNSTV